MYDRIVLCVCVCVCVNKAPPLCSSRPPSPPAGDVWRDGEGVRGEGSLLSLGWGRGKGRGWQEQRWQGWQVDYLCSICLKEKDEDDEDEDEDDDEEEEK